MHSHQGINLYLCFTPPSLRPVLRLHCHTQRPRHHLLLLPPIHCQILPRLPWDAHVKEGNRKGPHIHIITTETATNEHTHSLSLSISLDQSMTTYSYQHSTSNRILLQPRDKWSCGLVYFNTLVLGHIFARGLKRGIYIESVCMSGWVCV